MELETLARASHLLDSFAGRDKAIRSAYFSLVLVAKRMRDRQRADQLLAFAKQFSRTRLVCRMFSQPSLLHSALRIPAEWRQSGDKVDTALGSSVTLIYLACGWTELFGWLAEAGLIGAKMGRSVRWFQRCSLRLWVLALSLSIARTVRQLVGRVVDDLLAWRKLDRKWLRAQLLSLGGLVADFAGAVNGLPRGWLWAGRLSVRQCAMLHLAASLVGLHKQW